MEQLLLSKPRSFGITFVGVSVTPHLPPHAPLFWIWIGCDRSIEEQAIEMAVALLIRQKFGEQLHLKIEAHRGEIRGTLRSV